MREEVYEHKDKLWDIKLRYPVLEEGYEELNEMIKEDIWGYVPSTFEVDDPVVLKYQQFYMDLKAQIMYLDDKMMSMVITGPFYAGGVHPIDVFETLNVDLSSERPKKMTLKDYYKLDDHFFREWEEKMDELKEYGSENERNGVESLEELYPDRERLKEIIRNTDERGELSQSYRKGDKVYLFIETLYDPIIMEFQY